MNALQLTTLSLTVFTQGNLVEDFYTENGRFVFLSPNVGLSATHNDHLRLIGKHVVDFLLVLIELFSLGFTAEALRANICSKSAISLQRGPVDAKFQVEGVAPPTILFLRKLSYMFFRMV